MVVVKLEQPPARQDLPAQEWEVTSLSVGEAGTPRMTKTPFLVRQMSKWLYDTSTGTAMRAAHSGSFIGEGLGLSDVSYGETRCR
jgi:hypothetical protein